MSDSDQASRLSLEDTAFFDRVFQEHREGIFAYLVGRVSDREAAKDLLQEVFIRVWRHLSTLREIPPDRYRFWIFAVAKRIATDHLRNRVVRANLEEQVRKDPESVLPRSEEPHPSLEEKERLEQIDRAIRCLPEDLRTVLVMQALGGMSGKQIAESLGKPPGTIRYMIHQARKELIKEMEAFEGDTLKGKPPL